MTLSRRITAAVAVLFAAAGSLAAQSAAQNAAAADPQVPAVAAPAVEQSPVAAPASEGVHAYSPTGPTPVALPRREHVGSNVALMIVGGAVLVVGAVVGGTAGTLIMIGGGVVGIIGLYRYLQ